MSETEVISITEVREELSCSKGKSRVNLSMATGTSGPDQVLVLLAEAVDKIDKLTGTVNMLQNDFAVQNKRLDKLQPSSNNEASDRDSDQLQQTNLKASESKSKTNRGERQAKVSQHKTSSRGMNISDISSSFWDSSPENEIAHKGLDRQTKNARKGHSSCTIPSKGRQARNIVYEDSSDSNDSSDWSRCRLHKHSKSRTIKSGARVKQRPVVRTELWPHTVSNEEDGDEVSSENIGLAKFLLYFTHIMLSCGKAVETQGRVALLNAVCMIFEYLPWSEARTFHNLMMIKIEQERINWLTDFRELADKYVDQKVRLNLRSKSTYTDNSYSSKANYHKDPVKVQGRSSDGYQSYSGKGKFLQNVICWQWNFSSCSYGENCKRWHACRTCAEAGKLGESHKASSHENSSFKAKPGEQRG